MDEANVIIEKLPHHEKNELCKTRPAYRQGKKLTAVKVYTINDESQHIVIQGIPKLQLFDELKRLVSPYGIVKKIHAIADYPAEDFTEVFHVQYVRIQSARIAKRFLDGKNFYGGLLHVFYAPELENVSETRAKLIQRRRDVTTRIKRHNEDVTNPETDQFVPREQYQRKKKYPALPLTEQRLAKNYPNESMNHFQCQYSTHAGPPMTDLESPSTSTCPSVSYQPHPAPELLQAPYQVTEAILREAGIRESKIIPHNGSSKRLKRKNYKGHTIYESTKVRVVTPKPIAVPQTTPKEEETKVVFSNVKKKESGIVIKLKKDDSDEKKRIVIKNPNSSQLVQPSSEALQTSIQSIKLQVREAMKGKLS